MLPLQFSTCTITNRQFSRSISGYYTRSTKNCSSYGSVPFLHITKYKKQPSFQQHRTFCRFSAPLRGPYLEEYLRSPEWDCAMVPPAFYNWLVAFFVMIVGTYIVYMFHYNYYYFGTIWIKTHTGLPLTEDSW